MTHKLTIDRYWVEWFGVRFSYRYRTWCTCGWVGDRTKSWSQAQQVAESHAGENLDEWVRYA